MDADHHIDSTIKRHVCNHCIESLHWPNPQTFDILTAVTYALRKLIAFVFLGGMFWFIYQDLDNLDKPWFMHALGLITIAFAFFWLLIPMIVVKLRIHRRLKQNRERYEKWLADGGVGAIRPRPAQKVRLNPIDSDEQAFFHEKGTLYIAADVKSGNRRIVFAGKDLDISILFADLKKATVKPGGMVFEASENMRYAFTFQNPLVAADVLERART